MRQLLCLVISTVFSLHTLYAGKNLNQMPAKQAADEGYRLYEEGEYKEASRYLQHALENDHWDYLSAYAHICQSELDGEKHKMSEAALWSIRAAALEGGDAWSALNALDPMIVDEERDEQERLERLKECWRRQTRDYDADAGYGYWIKSTETEKADTAAELIQKASRLLKRASQGNHPLAQEIYSQICREGSDGKFHLLAESAGWLFAAARGGAPDATAYVQSEMPNFRDLEPEKAIKHLTSLWVLKETTYHFKPLKPGSVIQYLLETHSHLKIDVTSAQKIVYLFEKFVVGLITKMGNIGLEEGQSIFDEAAIPTEGHPRKKQRIDRADHTGPISCRADVPPIIKPAGAPWTFGPAYPTYWKALKGTVEAEKGDDLTPQKHKKAPHAKISNPLLRILIDSVGSTLEGKRAKEHVEWSHGEYPWLLAGIRYWKNNNPGQAFKAASLPESELIERLQTGQDIDPRDIRAIRDLVDTGKSVKQGGIWKNEIDTKGDSVAQEFTSGMHKFFRTARSINDKFVKKAMGVFFEKTRHQQLTIADNSKESLKSPLLMHLCQHLTVLDTSLSKPNYELLKNAARYFTNLEELFFKNIEEKSFRPKKQAYEGKVFIKALRKKGIKVRFKEKAGPAPAP